MHLENRCALRTCRVVGTSPVTSPARRAASGPLRQGPIGGPVGVRRRTRRRARVMERDREEGRRAVGSGTSWAAERGVQWRPARQSIAPRCVVLVLCVLSAAAAVRCGVARAAVRGAWGALGRRHRRQAICSEEGAVTRRNARLKNPAPAVWLRCYRSCATSGWRSISIRGSRRSCTPHARRRYVRYSEPRLATPASERERVGSVMRDACMQRATALSPPRTARSAQRAHEPNAHSAGAARSDPMSDVR